MHLGFVTEREWKYKHQQKENISSATSFLYCNFFVCFI